MIDHWAGGVGWDDAVLLPATNKEANAIRSFISLANRGIDLGHFGCGEMSPCRSPFR